MYNGHKNWTFWNVALWIGNDEGLYNLARSTVRIQRAVGGTMDEAARRIVDALPEKTPDGARYSFSAVRAAIRGLS